MNNPMVTERSRTGQSDARGRRSWLPPASDWSRYGHVVISHLLLLAAWQALVVFGKLPAFVLPTPIATAATLGAPSYHWISNTLATALEVYGGYALGVGAAVALRCCSAGSARSRRC